MSRFLLLLTACGAAPAAAPLLDNHTTSPTTYLVWNAGDDGRATTLEVDETGRILARDPGIVIAAAGTRWRLQITSTKRTLLSCDQLERNLPGPPTGGAEDGTVVELVPDGGGSPVELDARPADADSQEELTWNAHLLGSYGPYVFVETYQEMFGCGAHGGEDYGAHAIDLRSRAELAAPAADFDRVVQARRQLGLGDDGDDGSGQLVSWLPAWTDGTAHLRSLYAFDTCYECGNGLWSSYTSAAWVDGGDLPPPLDALPPVPRAVAVLAHGPHAGISFMP